MAVEDDGEGDAVVCVHGLGGTSNTWTPLMPALARHRVDPHRPAGRGRSHAALDRAAVDRALVDAVLRVCAQLGVDARALRRPLDGHDRVPAPGGARSPSWCAAWRCSAR